MIFLIEYDRPKGCLVQMKSFADRDKDVAQTERLNLELENHSRGIDREIVILDAASKTAVRRTHRRYFEDLAELLRFAN